MSTYLRIHQAAEQLGVHPRTIRRWLKDGRLPAVTHPNGERRIAQETISEILRLPTRTGETSPFTENAPGR